MKIQYNNFHNPGFIIADLPLNVFENLKQAEKNLHDSAYNHRLAGNIENEFAFPEAKPIINDTIMHLCELYDAKYNYMKTIDILSDNLPIELNEDNIWINYQKKHEFNPVHDHSGIYSFVIWLKVPYSLEDEIEHSPGKKSNKCVAGNFEFVYTNNLGMTSCIQIPTDNTYEGRICFFPARISHCVYPFYTSDDFRISISGNIKLKV